jgi:GT2 family glycosyltransferase
LDVTVISFDERLSAGRVRNIGIDNTTAPVVCFLAADCVAAQGWVAGRVARHREHNAVACAMGLDITRGCVAVAYQLYRFSTRLPDSLPDTRQLYGISFHRSVFDRYGPFRENLFVGEDTEYRTRIADSIEIAWAPEIVTYHHDPQNLRVALKDLRAKVRDRKWYMSHLHQSGHRRRLTMELLFKLRLAQRSLRSVEGLRSDRRLATRLYLFLFVAAGLVNIVSTRSTRPFLAARSSF